MMKIKLLKEILMTIVEKANKMKEAEIQKMSLEDYEKLLKQCLDEMYPTFSGREELMKQYQPDLEEFVRDGWQPNVAACAMMHGD